MIKDKPRVRKFYDEIDHLVNNVDNIFGNNLSTAIGPEHWNELIYHMRLIEIHSQMALMYMVEKVVPELDAHPDTEKKLGGVYIDGVRQ